MKKNYTSSLLCILLVLVNIFSFGLNDSIKEDFNVLNKIGRVSAHYGLDVSASPTSTVASYSLAIEEFAGLYACSDTVTISSDATGDTICAGASVTFTAIPGDGGTNPLYQWRVNGLNVGTNSSTDTFSTTTLQDGYVVSVVLTSDIAGCGAANPVVSDNLRMTVNPIPSAPIADSNGPVCAGGIINLTASTIAGASYSWIGPDSFTSTLQNPSISGATAAMAGTYSVTATVSGCTSNVGTTDVVVNPIPSTPTVGNDGPVCAGGTINLTASTIAGATYSWTGPNSFTSTIQNPSISGATAAMAGTYIVTATVSGCTSNVGTTDVVVNPIPSTPTAGNDGPVCAGGTINLTATAIAGATYSWTGPNSFTSSIHNPSISNTTAAMSGTYSVTATVSGCTSNVGTTNVVVNPIPVTIAGSNSPVCTGGTINLTATNIAGATYSWTGPNNFTSTTRNPSISGANAAMAGTYSVTATVSGCTSNVATTTVVVNPIPTAPSANNNGPVCAGGIINLTASTIAGATYSWTGPNSFTSSIQNPSISIATAAMAGTYNVTATVSGCTSNIATTTVVVNPIPSAPIANNNGPVCAGGTINLTASNITGATYSWTGPNGFTSTSQNPSISNATAAMAGTYSVRATVSGCSSNVGTTNVVVNPTVIPSVTISSTSTSICSSSGTPVTFTATPTNGGGTPTYQWKRNGTNITGATSSTYTATSLVNPSTITVTMTSNATCASPATVTSNSILMTFYTSAPTTGNGNNAASRPSGPTSICPGPAATGLIYNIPSNMTANAEYYVWNLPPGFNITSGTGTNQITVSVPGPGAVLGNNNISVTAYNPCGNSGASIALNVNIGNFAAVDVGPNFSMCVGSNPSLTNVLSGNATSVTWAITSGTGTISGGPYPTPFVYSPDAAAIASGSVTLRATTNTASGSCSSSVGIKDVTITINRPSVSPTSIVASTAIICNGGSTTLTQIGGSLGTGASWKWYSNSGFTTLVGTSNAADASLSVSPIVTTTYYLRAESTTGAPCTANSAAPGGVTVTVNQPSVAPTSISASTATICNGGSTTLTQSGGSLGTGASWKWYSDNTYTTSVGTGIGSNASLSVSPSTTTTYYLRAESANAPCTVDIAAPGSVTVTVNQPSIVPTSIVASTATICNGGSTALTQIGGSLGTGASWKWYSNSGFTTLVGTSNAADASLSVSPNATTTYYLRAESTTGGPCTANIAAPGSVTITVNQPSVAPTSISASTATICNGGSTTLTQTGGSLGTGASWKWYSDNTYTTSVGTGTGSNASLSVSPSTTTTYYLRAESANAPCTVDIAAPGSVTVTVNQPSIVPTSIVASTATICNGGSTTLTQTGGSLGTGAIWKWYSNSGFTTFVGTSNAADASLLVSPNVTTTYYLRAESTTGTPCTANIAATGSVTVTVNQPVVINTQPNPSQTICSGFPVGLSVTAIGTGLTYEWFKNGLTTGITSATFNINQAAVGDAGTYTVVVRGTAPCGNVISEDAVINVNQDIDISNQPSPQVICQGNNSSLSVTATGTGLSYQWRKSGVPISNGGTISGVTTNTLTFTGATVGNSGSYDVIISGSGNFCTQTISTSATLTVTQIPTATISYATPFCTGNATAQAVTLNGTNAYTGGIYSYSVVSGGPTLSLHASSGNITPSTSSAGTYTVIYTIPASGGCPANSTTTTNVTITPLPVASISYSAASYCESDSNTYNVTLTGSNNSNGTYSINPLTGLTMNPSGQISPNGAIPGNYTVSYTIPSSTGCPSVVATAAVQIQAQPNATFSYAAANYCSNGSIPTPTVTQTGGVFTASSSNLSINSSTGVINLSTSTPGSYTVNYTFAAVNGGCAQVQVTRAITITPLPIATISYSAAAYCKSDTNPYTVNLTGSNNSGGTFTASPVGLTMNSSGTITPNTSTAGTYTISYTIPASGGCAQVVATTSVRIDALPVATFTYNSTQYCTTGTTPVLTFTGGGTAGNFSATPAGLSLNGSTGAINLATSAAGTYTVTNTIPAASGCPTVQSSQSFTVFNVAVGGNITGYLNSSPTIISNNIMACQEGSGIFTLNGQTGNIIRWESSTNGGQTWTTIANTSNTLNFNSVTSTTLYRVVLQNGPCSLQYSAIALVNIIPTNIRPTVTPSTLQTVCYGTNVNYTSTSGYGTGQFIQGGNFNNSNPAGWKVDGISHLPASGSSTSSGPWSIATGPRTFNSTTYNSSDNKFVITSGNFISNLETPVFNTFGLTTATVQFYQAYVLTAGAQAIIELSLDGGATYNINLSTINGAAAAGPYNGFGYTSIDLQNYIGQPNLRIRFRYVGTTSSSWALDNFVLPSAPINETIQWIDINGNVLSTNGAFVYTPPSPGLHTFGVTSMINGCRSLGPDGTTYVNVAANLAYAGKNITPLLGECGENTVTLNAYDNTLTAAQNIANGAFDNNYGTGTNPGTGAGGTWSVDSGPATCGGTPSFSSLNNPRATFTGPAGSYTLRWTVAGCSGTVQVTLNDCQTVDFDGVDDYVTFGNTYSRGNNFSIEAWIKPVSLSGIQTILSKRDGNINGDGYDLRLNGSTISFNWNATGSISSPFPITTNRWYHVAVTFGGDTYSLYVDGIQVNTSAGSAPSSNSLKFLLGAMDQTGNPPNKPILYFRGWMDEVRLWNKTITQEQIRQMMNQEIRNNGAVAGEVVPLDVSGLNWTDLDGYYRMDIGCGALQPFAGTATGKLRNITSVQPQTAPIPYTSNVSGQNWETNSTWTNFAVWDAPNSIGIDGTTRIDWNIVRTSHDIISDNRDLTLLGLLVDANELIISGTGPQDETNNGTGLLITHYLKIDGKIDLVGESQLVQDKYTPTQISESFFDSTSAGIIERDQQGTGNPFNYNYWGSPVAPGNASVTSSNVSTNNYTISGILRAGTNTIPDPLNNAPINWIGGQTAVFGGGNNVQLSTRWLYTYANISNTYANWAYVGNSGAIKIGLGYSMKGNGTDPGPVTFNGAKQNYVFVGKPNNGTITNPIAINNDILAGNPYPSAIDANEFIKDNLPSFNPDGSPTSANNNSSQSINGTLYFWEHYQSNNSHVLREYIGGYATYSLGGGLEAVTPPPTVDGVQIVLGFNGTRRPERYVPVGQGFFVSANPEASGVANITFKNSQRIFKREVVTYDANDGSLFFRTTNSMADADADLRMKRVRLRFNSPEGAHRPLLLSFEPNNLATDGVDYGYDALNNDSFPSDLSWLIDGNGYVIQGVGEFNTTNQYPFAMKLAVSGLITITLTDLENFDESIDVYVYDSLLQAYHQINTMDFTMTLDAGNYDNRFYLTFAVGQTLSTTENEIDNVVVNYLQNTNEIYIKATNDIHIKQVYLINIIGQTIKSWNMTNIPLSDEIRIPTKNVPEGTYIIKVTTNKSIINKKAIIKY